MRDLDEDKDDNIASWSYRRIKIPYVDIYTRKTEYFWPSFYVMTKGKEFKGKRRIPLDFPYFEYIVHIVSDIEITDANLLDEDDYNSLSIDEKEWYDYNFLLESYNGMRFSAAKEYCKKNNAEFIANYPEGKNVTILDKLKFN